MKMKEMRKTTNGCTTIHDGINILWFVFFEVGRNLQDAGSARFVVEELEK